MSKRELRERERGEVEEEEESKKREKSSHSYLETASVVEAAAGARHCPSTEVEERVGRGVKGGCLGRRALCLILELSFFFQSSIEDDGGRVSFFVFVLF